MYNYQQNQQDYQYQNVNMQNKQDDSTLFVSARVNFIRKVFGIVASQLSLTALMIYFAQTRRSFARFQMDNDTLMVLSMFVSVAIILVLGFVKSISQKTPYNYALLGLFTLSESYAVSAITLGYPQEIVLSAAFLTAAVTIGLTIYAFTCKKDFTYLGGSFFILLSATLALGLFNLFVRSDFIFSLLAYGGVFIYGFYLIYDIQLLAGGKRKEISIDDYITGSMMLYIDIIQLFIKILRILGKEGEKKDEKKK